MHVLNCDPSCSACTGPTENDCTACNTGANEILVDGDCVCNIDNGYYNKSDGSGCTQICSANTQYLNPTTRTCTTGCPVGDAFPEHFKYKDTSNNRQYCVVDCPANFYKYYSNMSCVDDCYDSTIADNVNYYNFDGLDKVCYQDCPDGYYGDPVSGSCVTLCPVTSGNAGYFVLGEICSLYCDGSTYAYHETRECLAQCPTGFYSNTFTTGGTAHNICEE